MDTVNEYLKKFKFLLASAVARKKILAEAVAKHTGIEMETKNITTKGGEVFINTTPARKSLILLKKTQILTEVEKQIGRKIIFDIH